MKIAILGTRGIPNKYGGFERFAEVFSLCLVKEGYVVTVYNPDTHPYRKSFWNGVKIKHIFSKENKIGSLGNFIFDFLSLRDALREEYDIILELGYAPASLFYFLKEKKKSLIFTNMDGLEWKREKWNKIAKTILKLSEKLAVKKSNILIADNKEIKKYIYNKYGKNSFYIPYGAKLFENPDDTILEKYNLKKDEYYLLIARFEPENNIDKILSGFLLSDSRNPLLLIGDYNNKYGKSLYYKYEKNKNIKFLGSIYDKRILDNLRYFSRIYFHGHSVGGTNPSLLEAMAAHSFIVAHNNIFNKSVLGDDALYFNNADDIKKIILEEPYDQRQFFIENNRKKILKHYNWDKIFSSYLKIIEKEFVKRKRSV